MACAVPAGRVGEGPYGDARTGGGAVRGRSAAGPHAIPVEEIYAVKVAVPELQ